MKLPSPPLATLCVGIAVLLSAGLSLPRAKADPLPGTLAALSPLEQLTAPIALYPDPLVALILPASTLPSEIASAARFLGGNDDPSQIDSQPWDSSVRGLAHYPSVLEWMAQNLDWTVALGNAFTAQPAAVMDSIQRLRAMAQADGALVNTPQQEIVEEGDALAIVPEDPAIMFVPSYDPAVVYFAGPASGGGGPWITFGIGLSVGPWLGYDFDWRGRALWRGDWRNWHDERGWGHPVFPGQQGYIGAPNSRQWRPAPARPGPGYTPLPPTRAVRPQPMVGAPRPPEARLRVEGGGEVRSGPPAGWHLSSPADPTHRGAAPAQPRAYSPQIKREPPPTAGKNPNLR